MTKLLSVVTSLVVVSMMFVGCTSRTDVIPQEAELSSTTYQATPTRQSLTASSILGCSEYGFIEIDPKLGSECEVMIRLEDERYIIPQNIERIRSIQKDGLRIQLSYKLDPSGETYCRDAQLASLTCVSLTSYTPTEKQLSRTK